MATYKVLQDIEAEDKLLGPLTLKQFIFAAIAAICLYLSFFALTKHVPFLLAFFLPIALVAGFLAWPWSRDQPTEVWLLAKIRFFLKPRRRVWDQDGMQELVTITVPKKVDKHLTNNLSQIEVKSRLRALANTIDSRGWAVKNINVNLSTSPAYVMPDPTSDRLIDVSELPHEVPNVDVTETDDIFENPTAAHFDQMIGTTSKQRRQQLMQQVKTGQPPAQPAASLPAPQDMWFGQPATPPSTGSQTQPLSKQDEQALLAQLHPDPKPQAAFGHMKVIDPKGPNIEHRTSKVEPVDPVIQQLAGNDDLNIDTIARQAHKNRKQPPDDEVVVPLR